MNKGDIMPKYEEAYVDIGADFQRQIRIKDEKVVAIVSQATDEEVKIMVDALNKKFED
jgi:hypothetical protein